MFDHGGSSSSSSSSSLCFSDSSGFNFLLFIKLSFCYVLQISGIHVLVFFPYELRVLFVIFFLSTSNFLILKELNIREAQHSTLTKFQIDA